MSRIGIRILIGQCAQETQSEQHPAAALSLTQRATRVGMSSCAPSRCRKVVVHPCTRLMKDRRAGSSRALFPGYVGLINLNTSPAEVFQQAVEDARYLCERGPPHHTPLSALFPFMHVLSQHMAAALQLPYRGAQTSHSHTSRHISTIAVRKQT